MSSIKKTVAKKSESATSKAFTAAVCGRLAKTLRESKGQDTEKIIEQLEDATKMLKFASSSLCAKKKVKKSKKAADAPSAPASPSPEPAQPPASK